MNYRLTAVLLGLGLLTLSVIQPVLAQNARLSRFTASPVAEKVLLDWVVAAGATCDGIGVYRGSDTVGMTLIHYIPGVCGDLARPVSYTFLDSFPLANQTSFYRLELGPRIFTDFVRVSLVDLSGHAYQFRPHPVIDEANLYFAREINGLVTLLIFDGRGQRRFTLTFSDNTLHFSTQTLENGLYFFFLIQQDGSLLQRGKMLVQR